MITTFPNPKRILRAGWLLMVLWPLECFAWPLSGESNIFDLTPSPANTYFVGESNVFSLVSEAPGSVVIYAYQSYQVDHNLLSLGARVQDTLYDTVISGSFRWSLKNSSGTEISDGDMSFSAAAGQWHASRTFVAGLSPGRYTVHYSVTTDRGRTGYTEGTLIVGGLNVTVTGTITDTADGSPLSGAQVAMFEAGGPDGLWTLVNAEYGGIVPPLETLLSRLSPVQDPVTTGSDGAYQWLNIPPGGSYVIVVAKHGYVQNYTSSFALSASETMVAKSLSLPADSSALAVLRADLIGSGVPGRPSMEEEAKKALDELAELIAEVARRVNEDELFKLDLQEIGVNLLAEVFSATATGIVKSAVWEAGIRTVSEEALKQSIQQVLKNRLARWAVRESLRTVAKTIGNLVKQAVSGQALEWTRSDQYRESGMFEPADAAIAKAHAMFEQNLGMELNNAFSIAKAREAIGSLVSQYQSVASEAPIASLVPFNPEAEPQLLMLKSTRNAYFQLSGARKGLITTKKVATAVQVALSGAQLIAGGLTVGTSGAALPATGPFIAGAQVVKEHLGIGKIALDAGTIAIEYLLVIFWGNGLASVTEDSEAIAENLMIAVEFLINEAESPCYIHKDRDYDGEINLDLNLPLGLPILWRMPLAPIATREATVGITNTGHAPAQYRIVASGVWAPGKILGKEYLCVPTCFDVSKTFALDSAAHREESLTYVGYDVALLGILAPHHVTVDLYAGPFHVDEDHKQFWVANPLQILSFGMLASQKRIGEMDFNACAADAGGMVRYAQIKQRVSDGGELARGFLSAAMPSLSVEFVAEPDLFTTDLRLFAPQESEVSIFVTDAAGRRLGYSASDGITYGELLGGVTNMAQRPILMSLLDPTPGGKYTVELALLSPGPRDVPVTLFYEPVRRSSAIMTAFPSPLILDGDRDAAQSLLLRVAEASGQHALTGVTATLTSMEMWGGGTALPVTGNATQQVGDVPASEQRYVSWDVAYADQQERGKYSGTVTLRSNETADLVVPVVALVRGTTETISFYEGSGSTTGTLQKTLTLGLDGSAPTWVHIPDGFGVVYAAMGVVGDSADLTDPSVDIGADGTDEWAFSGKFDLGVLVDNVEDSFNAYLEANDPEETGWDVPVEVKGTPGQDILLNGIQLYLERTAPQVSISSKGEDFELIVSPTSEGKNYLVKFADNMEGPWLPATTLAGQDGQIIWMDDGSATASPPSDVGQRFYLVEVQ